MIKLGIFDNAVEVVINNKVVKSIKTPSGGVLYEKVIETVLSIDVPLNIVYSDAFNISGTLKDSNQTGLVGETVKLKVGNTVVDSTTTTTGGAYSFTQTPVATGNHSFQVIYEGTIIYNASESSIVNRVVGKETTVLTVTQPVDNYITPNKYIQIVGTLTDDDGTVLANKMVKMSDNMGNRYNCATENDGKFNGGFTFPSDGSYTLTISYEGDSNYSASSVNRTVIVREHDYALSISADKSILSYEDRESATITALLTDNNIAVTGETLTYTVKHESTTIDTGSATTDSNGRISFEYESTGVGDVDIIVDFGILLQETYEIEDDDFYDDTTRDRTSDYTFTRVVYDRNNNGSQSISFNNNLYNISVTWGGCYYFIPLTTKSQVELSYISKSPYTNDTGDCGFGLIDRTGNVGNSVYTRVNGTRRFTKNSSATYWTHIYNESGSSLADVEIKHIITVNGLSFTYKAIRTDNQTVIWEYSNTFDSNLTGKELGIITGWGNCSHTIKNIKVKAL